jgi:two-component system NtrC family response regulator
LLDSQLFGHRRGAFTGAVADQEGLFQAASGGTLFLDEVSEIPLSLQPKFLRAVQEREVTPLGSTRPVRVDLRLIAATNKDLRQEMLAGRFREDLFYRLNVVNVHLPPLIERREDVDLLVEHFVQEFARSYAVSPKRLTPAARALLLSHDWPGNVRELQNAIERAFALSRSSIIGVEDLSPALGLTDGRPLEPATTRGDAPGGAPATEVMPLEEAERLLIAAALEQARGNKNEAARLLRIDRQRLYRKMERYDLK